MLTNATKSKKVMISSAAVITVVVLTYLLKSSSSLPNVINTPQATLKALPDFASIVDVKTKKQQFFETLYPIIAEENAHIMMLRETVIGLRSKPELSKSEKQWVSELASSYKVKLTVEQKGFYQALLKKLDYVPASLALTQAAIESGWGSSRFSKQGNNLFGHWCFRKGCGMVPSSRDEGKGHEVAKFKTVNASVRAYIKNLNTNHAYASLRETRASLRKAEKPVTGVVLAKSLNRYSEEGDHYVAKVTKFIRQNKLNRYNTLFEEQYLQRDS
ncbi:glucosaminidase domain-containing protein [Thalassotalea sp. LPB0316]|uniref:glucosaminidase domain-containing protein n=1 Tax=Thalassotalea sp. LPB0316 TaxID=2769490 RepID=UPI001867C3D9|nr:glucosaminidase domain-containing protein [Thalassotalea sp. LPB0316]QOL25633.1 glucosaminidase domain-containing protein [Thalassotalea sp. LPB0316]